MPLDKTPDIGAIPVTNFEPTHTVSVDTFSSEQIHRGTPVLAEKRSHHGGMRIRHLNGPEASAKPGMDSFAVHGDTFVVCDGVGTERRSKVVADWMARAATEMTLGDFMRFTDTNNPNRFTELFAWCEKAVIALAKSGEFTKERLTVRPSEGPELNHGSTTLSIVRRMIDGSWGYIVIGDSPLYTQDKDGTWSSVGTEKTGKSYETAGFIGMRMDSDTPSLKMSEIHNGKGVAVGRIPKENLRRFVLTSDWFSDNFGSEHDRRTGEAPFDPVQQLAQMGTADAMVAFIKDGAQKKSDDVTIISYEATPTSK